MFQEIFEKEIISRQKNQKFIDYIENCRNNKFNSSNISFFYNNFKYPKISVVTPVHNKELYIDILMCSLENQSLKKVEFIFIDDFSTDNSAKKIKQYMKKDKKIRLINNYKNKGVFHSRYLGTIFSRGIYIYFLDPDDLVYDILKEAYEAAIKEELDIVEFLFCEYINGVYKRGTTYNLGPNYIRRNDQVKYYMFLNSFENKKYIFAHAFLWDKIIKREIVLKAYSEIGSFYLNIHLIVWDDTLLSFFIFRNAKSHKYVNKFGYSWNLGNSDSISSISNSMNLSKIVNKRFHDIFTYLKIIYEKTEDIEIDRKCIITVWNKLYTFFHGKLKYLTDGFELIDSVFKLYMSIKYLSADEQVRINEYYNSFLEIKKKIYK